MNKKETPNFMPQSKKRKINKVEIKIDTDGEYLIFVRGGRYDFDKDFVMSAKHMDAVSDFLWDLVNDKTDFIFNQQP